MTGQGIQRKRLPDSPGVYFFLGKDRKILYIGRATSLRDRIGSYFTGDIIKSRGPWIKKMLKVARSLDFQKTDSVLETILLEAKLIRTHRPPYNTDLKDDRSFNCIVITKEKFPRVLLVRQKDILPSSLVTKDYKPSLRAQCAELKNVFGPFPHGFKLAVAFKIIRKIFPFRDSHCIPNQGGPCFSRQIRLCPGVCTGEISSKEYTQQVKRLTQFLSGKKRAIINQLNQEMKKAAEEQEFEKANEFKRQLFSLKHIQDIALIQGPAGIESDTLKSSFRIEGYDLSHFGGKEIVGAMSVVINAVANPGEYRLFKLRGIKNAHEAAGLQEIVSRRLNHLEWPLPHCIVVDGNEVQKRIAEKIVAAPQLSVPVVSIIKDERHRPRKIIGDFTIIKKHRSAILLANSEAHRFALRYHRLLRSRFTA